MAPKQLSSSLISEEILVLICPKKKRTAFMLINEYFLGYADSNKAKYWSKLAFFFQLINNSQNSHRIVQRICLLVRTLKTQSVLLTQEKPRRWFVHNPSRELIGQNWIEYPDATVQKLMLYNMDSRDNWAVADSYHSNCLNPHVILKCCYF